MFTNPPCPFLIFKIKTDDQAVYFTCNKVPEKPEITMKWVIFAQEIGETQDTIATNHHKPDWCDLCALFSWKWKKSYISRSIRCWNSFALITSFVSCDCVTDPGFWNQNTGVFSWIIWGKQEFNSTHKLLIYCCVNSPTKLVAQESGTNCAHHLVKEHLKLLTLWGKKSCSIVCHWCSCWNTKVKHLQKNGLGMILYHIQEASVRRSWK